MRLNSQGSQFIFNLPSDFLPSEIISTYKPVLEKNWIQYDNVLDYLNSTIKGVNFPGITVDLPEQRIMRGKSMRYSSAVNVQDIVGHEITVKFASVDADLNYWLMFDIFTKHYLDVNNIFVKPFIITALDIWRDGIYQINFFEIVLKSLSGNDFDYSQQKINAKEFQLTFNFNFYGVEFLLGKSKVLELATVPQIIQKI